MTIGYTIGGMMVFPGNRIAGKWTSTRPAGASRRSLVTDDYFAVKVCMPLTIAST